MNGRRLTVCCLKHGKPWQQGTCTRQTSSSSRRRQPTSAIRLSTSATRPCVPDEISTTYWRPVQPTALHLRVLKMPRRRLLVPTNRIPSPTWPYRGGEAPNLARQARQQLLLARRALAVGDATQAEVFAAKAKQFGAVFSPAEDSPERVTQSINDFKTLQANKNNTPAWRQGYAKFLVQQANKLLEHGDLDRAEQVAYEATGLQAEFGVSDTSPNDILNRIASVRNGKPLPQSQVASEQPLSKAKGQSLALLAEARQALEGGNLPQAELLASQASRLNVAESQFAAGEDSPAKLALEIQRARTESEAIQLARSNTPEGFSLPMFDTPPEDVPHIAAAPEHVPTPLPAIATDELPLSADPYAVISQAEQALRSGDRREALRLFKLAKEQRDQLDPITLSRLQDHLQMLAESKPASSGANGDSGSLLNSTGSDVIVLARQLSAEVGRQQAEAAKLRTSDPDAALEMLDEISQKVENSELDEGMKRQLQRRISMTVADTEQYIRDNKSELELEAANNDVMADIERAREVKLQVQQRLAELNDQYNQYRNEHRYAEMEIVAKRAIELAPDELVAQMMWTNAKFIRREMLNQEIIEKSEVGVAETFLGSSRYGRQCCSPRRQAGHLRRGVLERIG